MPIRGLLTKVWKNTPSTLRDVFLSSRIFAAREFIIYENDRSTYDSNARATLALAARLLADGVRKGDRVAIIMRNLPEWPVAFFAGQLLGAIVTPLNAWWTGPELVYGLSDSGAKIAIVDDERMARIAPCLDSLVDLVRVYATRLGRTPNHPKVVRLEDVIGPVNDWSTLPDLPLPQVELAPDDEATIIYTSGTTGKPKGALGTHRNMTTNIGTNGITAARNFLRAGEPLPESDPHKLAQRVGLLVVPMFHVTGLSTNLVSMMNSGGKIVLMRRWEAEDAMRLIEAEQVTSTGGVPTIVWQLIEHPARAHYDLTSLTLLSYGGAPASPDLVEKITTTFPGSMPGPGLGDDRDHVHIHVSHRP